MSKVVKEEIIGTGAITKKVLAKNATVDLKWKDREIFGVSATWLFAGYQPFLLESKDLMI
ncbi:MAG: hypothetical protein V1897_02430 [Pseudomonadota bacterium]